MKNWMMIGLLTLATLSVAGAANTTAPALLPAPTAKNETELSKPIRYVNGTIRVNRSWMVKTPDGSFGSKFDTVCKAPVKIGFFQHSDKIDPKSLTVFECVTETHKKEPLKIIVWGGLSIGITDPTGEAQQELIFSGSYAIVDSPQPFNGSFAMFSTKDLNLKSGTLMIPAQQPWGMSPEQLENHTFYAVTLSYEQ